MKRTAEMDTQVLRTSAVALYFSTSEYAVWEPAPHAKKWIQLWIIIPIHYSMPEVYINPHLFNFWYCSLFDGGHKTCLRRPNKWTMKDIQYSVGLQRFKGLIKKLFPKFCGNKINHMPFVHELQSTVTKMERVKYTSISCYAICRFHWIWKIRLDVW